MWDLDSIKRMNKEAMLENIDNTVRVPVSDVKFGCVVNYDGTLYRTWGQTDKGHRLTRLIPGVNVSNVYVAGNTMVHTRVSYVRED